MKRTQNPKKTDSPRPIRDEARQWRREQRSGQVPDAASRQEMCAQVLAGLSRRPLTLPCKYFYDAAGSQLFERICALPEYYLTRTEMGILQHRLDAIAACIGPGATLIEYGSGSSIKTRLLLRALERPAAYVPIDISASALAEAVAALRREFADLTIHPVCADYTRDLDLPDAQAPPQRRVIFFPGSTIGNFEPPEAAAFLRRARHLAGEDGAMLIGVDLKKDPAVLHAAYNDAAGVTAAFNRNLLRHLNRVLGADFDPRLFHHYAFFNPREGRVEMHLVSRRTQRVQVGGRGYFIQRGESIQTESSYKYSLGQFRALAAAGGWTAEHVWTDPRRWFALLWLRAV